VPSEEFILRHYSFPPAVDRPHFRGSRFAAGTLAAASSLGPKATFVALPADDDPGWESHQGGRRIRVHGPFLVGDLECDDGWLVAGNDGALSVEEAS